LKLLARASKLLARATRRKEEIKGTQIGKKVVKASLFTDDMIFYQKDPKNSTPKLLDTINSFSKVAGYKINLKNQWPFYTPTMNRLRKNIGK
jgi:hypothetical protein